MPDLDQPFKLLWQLSKMKKTWKVLRKSLRDAGARDALDYLEFDSDAHNQITALRSEVLNGTYSPSTPRSFEVAKSRGSYRVLSILDARDLLVFRHIADEIYRRAKVHEAPGAFFGQKHPSVRPVGEPLTRLEGSDFYENAFQIWLRYQQYRTQTLLSAIRPIFVATDVTNFFESVQHDLLLEYLGPLGLPRKCIGLLAKLLETYKPSSGHSPTPRVGLPVDEHDCSRQLAHVFLFEHDHRVIKSVGRGHYVRWMDDQNIAVQSETEARKMVRLLTGSLSQQRLVLNAGKTLFLTPQEVAETFHLEINDGIDDLEERIEGGAGIRQLRVDFRDLFNRACEAEGSGHWDKILKRFYGLAARLRSRSLRRRALDDLIRYPLLADRIFQYFVALEDWDGLLNLFERFVTSGESLYESVETQFFESLLCCNVSEDSRGRLRDFGYRWLTGQIVGTGRAHSRGIAALGLYWLGDGRSVRSIESVLQSEGRHLPSQVVRALLAVMVALAPNRLDDTLAYCASSIPSFL